MEQNRKHYISAAELVKDTGRQRFWRSGQIAFGFGEAVIGALSAGLYSSGGLPEEMLYRVAIGSLAAIIFFGNGTFIFINGLSELTKLNNIQDKIDHFHYKNITIDEGFKKSQENQNLGMVKS